MALRIAFTGTGYISRIHARAAARLEDVELAAVVNHRKDSMKAFAEEFSIPRQYETIEALIADNKADAISINTPNYLHASQAAAALHSGIHVMLEKPMAMNAQEAAEVHDAAKASGAVLMVAHCWRFDPEAIWLREQIAAGRLGKVIRTKGYGVHSNWGPSGWFTQARYAGGGALADMGIHAIDTVRFLLGDPQPQQVYARIGTHYGEYDVDDTGIIIVEWEGGITSYIESGWWQPHMDGPEASTQVYGQSGFGQLYPTLLRLPDRARSAVDTIESGFPSIREPHAPQSMYDAQMAYFVDCIRQGRKPVPGGSEGLVNMQIVDAAYESNRTSRAVDVKPI